MNPRAGLSLLNVLLGASLLSFLILPLFLHFETARSGASRNAHNLTAVNLASNRIETLKRLGFRRIETLLLTQGTIESVEDDEVLWPNFTGPFETTPERPDLREKGILEEGGILYDRFTFLSYFPFPNPDPNDPKFPSYRRRIQIRVVVRWKEKIQGGKSRQRHFEMATMIHDATSHAKPSLRPEENTP